MRRLRTSPVSLADARVFVATHHRHHQAPTGHKFSLAVSDLDGIRRGVVIVGRPVARRLDDGQTLEATRVCADGTRNACSALLGAAWRHTRALGYHRLITYTQSSESGASLRGAGWRLAADLPPRGDWNSRGRIRNTRHPVGVPRRRWEVTTPELPLASAGDETPRSCVCAVCAAELPERATGRPAVYCSRACRQAAYRARRTDRAKTR